MGSKCVAVLWLSPTNPAVPGAPPPPGCVGEALRLGWALTKVSPRRESDLSMPHRKGALLSQGYCGLAGIPGLDAKGQEAKRVTMIESEELAFALNKE